MTGTPVTAGSARPAGFAPRLHAEAHTPVRAASKTGEKRTMTFPTSPRRGRIEPEGSARGRGGRDALRQRHIRPLGLAGVDLARAADLRSGSSTISFQWAIQPGRRPSANITVNMFVGMPSAR